MASRATDTDARVRAQVLRERIARLPRERLPGRYEGEPRLARFFDAVTGHAVYDEEAFVDDAVFYLWLGGFRDEEIDQLCRVVDLDFTLTENERAVLREMAGAILCRSSMGFVTLSIWADRDELESEWDAIEDLETGEADEG
jgi:hypothetical protein